MYAHGCSIQRLAELQAPGTRRLVDGSRWRMVVDIMTSVDIIAVFLNGQARPALHRPGRAALSGVFYMRAGPAGYFWAAGWLFMAD
jgi:hypothetical protein